MAFRFRKSLKIVPGLRLNLSKSGVSLSAGKKGATINVSKRGTRLTAGIPGSGLSYSVIAPKKAKPVYKNEPLSLSSTDWDHIENPSIPAKNKFLLALIIAICILIYYMKA